MLFQYFLSLTDHVTDDAAIYREVPGMRIPGGSEDVLLDLSVRQLVKVYKLEEAKLGQSKM